MLNTVKIYTVFCITCCLFGCATSLPHTSSSADKNADQKVVNYAKQLIGTPYRYGGKTPQSGFDCSGFVAHVYQKAGITLSGNATDMATQGKTISQSALRPGDLVFFNTSQRPISHVGIYVGDGQFIHAPSTGSAIRISNMRNTYFARHFVMARTYFNNNTDITVSQR